MELVEAAKKIAVVEGKAISIKMLVCEAEERASEVERAFQQMKAHHYSVIKEAMHSDQKLKEIAKWLALMSK